MIPTDLYSSPTSTFHADDPQEDHHQLLQLHTAKPDQASASSPLSTHVFTFNIQNQEAINFGLHNDPAVLDGEISDQGLILSPWKKEDGHDQDQSDRAAAGSSGRMHMPSKMRVIRKMMKSDWTVVEAPPATAQLMKFEDQKGQQPPSPLEADSSSNSSSNNHIIRVCADCNTNKTPLWRSGPRGPKSLCNACGIRQRKARRAAAAAAAANGTIQVAGAAAVKTKVQKKYKQRSQQNKRSKLATQNGTKMPCLEDLLVSLSKSLAFHRVFPQDEKEAAILLMALSCGLLHG